MKTIFSLLIFLTFSFFNSNDLHAQSGYKSQIDSVQLLLNKLSKSDTMQVIELVRLARLCIYDLQYERGLTAISEARTLAKAMDYPQGKGLYWRTLDILHYNYNQAGPYHVLTYLIFKDLKKVEYPIDIQSPNQIDQVKRKEALAIASKALEKKGNKEMAAHAYHLLAFNYLEEKNVEMALESIEKAERIFKDLSMGIPLIESKILKAKILKHAGRDLEVRNVELQMAQISEAHNDERERSLLYSLIGSYYFWNTKQTDIALDYALKCVQGLEYLGEKYFLAEAYFLAGATFHYLSFPQKTAEYLGKSFDLIISGNINEGWLRGFYNFFPSKLVAVGDFKKAEEIIAIGKSINTSEEYLLNNQGIVLMGKGQYNEALEMFYKFNILRGAEKGAPGKHSWMNYYIAYSLSRLGKLKESNRFALKSYQQASQATFRNYDIKKASYLLYENYEKLGQPEKALEYLKIYTDLVKKDKQQNILNRTAKMEIQAVVAKSEQEKKMLEQEKLEQEKTNQNQRWWLFSIAAGLLSSLLVLFLLFKNNKNKQKANLLLEQQKEEINTQKNKAEEALSNLKSTQSQLIQSEKMASLGELTAGIAHEIQNPLNFVNNFAEVSGEMIEELKEERTKEKGERDLGLEEEILDDIVQNLVKINHHGQRASGIVKGMLEHSRTSTGKKELTDINILADEYLRLAYHGLRAKDKSFNADFKTEFDESIPKLNVVSQDIGRVLLNLINNAFYTVSARAKDNEAFKPEVVVATKKADGQIMISVKDNGEGIPEHIRNKIFQPFFTTKPTGSGTGLGLSLAYDIITKGHDGELVVESEEGEGTEFKIILPVV